MQQDTKQTLRFVGNIIRSEDSVDRAQVSKERETYIRNMQDQNHTVEQTPLLN